MAATFSFTTTTILSGHSMRIYSTGTNWDDFVPGTSTAVVITLKALRTDDEPFTGTSNTFTKTLATTAVVGDWYIDLTATEMFGVDEIIPDNIFNVKIDITGGVTYTYNTDEVFYYNAWVTKSEICYAAVDAICDINATEIKYACMVNCLYQGLIADIVSANTSGIYEKIDIFNRIAL